LEDRELSLVPEGSRGQRLLLIGAVQKVLNAEFRSCTGLIGGLTPALRLVAPFYRSVAPRPFHVQLVVVVHHWAKVIGNLVVVVVKVRVLVVLESAEHAEAAEHGHLLGEGRRGWVDDGVVWQRADAVVQRVFAACQRGRRRRGVRFFPPALSSCNKTDSSLLGHHEATDKSLVQLRPVFVPLPYIFGCMEKK
jgi:hypothetical protein